MNAAIPVEEAYKLLTDEKQNGHLVLLDAKAAFDKVMHSHLFQEFRTKHGLLLKACNTMRKAALSVQEARSIVLRSVLESSNEVSLVLISINYISTHY